VKIKGNIDSGFRQKETIKKTRMKPCNTLVHPDLSYGSENWTIKFRETKRKLTAEEMRCMRKTAAHTWDRLQDKHRDGIRCK